MMKITGRLKELLEMMSLFGRKSILDYLSTLLSVRRRGVVFRLILSVSGSETKNQITHCISSEEQEGKQHITALSSTF